MIRTLPPRPHLEHLAGQAKALRSAIRTGTPQAIERLRTWHPRFHGASATLAATVKLSDAQLVIAREHGFASWPRLKRHVERTVQDFAARAAALSITATTGDLTRLRELLTVEPALSAADLYVACATGDADAALAFLERTPALASTPGGPHQWPALLYVCHSRLPASDHDRRAGLARIASSLLEHGADPNAYFSINDDPNARQTALYGAAGIANDPTLTRVLLEAGADPNDAAPGLGPESLYHAAEFEDHRCLQLILAAGPDRDKISYCLGHKLDFEDPVGVQLFLEHGADPNFVTPGSESGTRLHGAIRRGRSVETIELLVRFGGDLRATTSAGFTPYALAVRCGHAQAAALLERHGADPGEARPLDRFVGACRRADQAAIDAQLGADPTLLQQLTDDDRRLLPEAAQLGDLEAVRKMLEVGFDPAVPGEEGLTAAHWAGWRGDTELLDAILAYDPPLEVLNRYGGTVLDCTVYGSRHCHHPQGPACGTRLCGRYRECVQSLLAAGADPRAVSPYPSGTPEVDALLHPVRADAPPAAQPSATVDPLDESDHAGAASRAHTELFTTPGTPILVSEWMAEQADTLLAGWQQADPAALSTLRFADPTRADRSEEAVRRTTPTLEEARAVLARIYWFDSWEAVQSANDRWIEPRFEAAVDALVDGEAETLAALLRADETLVRARSAFGHRVTLLHYVSANGVETRRQRTPTDIVALTRLLLDAGAEVDALCDSYGGGPGATALSLAVSSYHPHAAGVQAAIVETLLDHGAAIEGLMDDGMPLATALAFDYDETAATLVRRGARVSNLVIAAALGDAQQVTTLLHAHESGTMPPYLDPFGERIDDRQRLLDRALGEACKRGHLAIATQLIDAGATIDATALHGASALHWAAGAGQLAIVQLLVTRGADTNLRDVRWHAPPIEWARQNGHAAIVTFLQSPT